MSTTTRRKSAAYQHHQAYRGAGGAPIKVKVHTFVPAAATSGGRSFGKKKKRGRRLSVAANFALQSAMGKEAVSTLALTEEEVDDINAAAAANWVRHEDEQGNAYWYNEETYETSWTDPARDAGDDSGDLLPGWVELDDGEGGKYYHNEVSGDTSWERPSAAVEAALPAGWYAVSTPDGETYYHNEETDETSWEVPTSPDGTPAPALAELPPSWEEVVGEDGVTYYHNTETGETAWDRPAWHDGIHPDLAAAAAAFSAQPRRREVSGSKRKDSAAHARRGSAMLTATLGADALASFQVADSGLPAGWEEVIDPESGEPYWYCEATGLTTWDKPVAMAIDEVVQDAGAVSALSRMASFAEGEEEEEEDDDDEGAGAEYDADAMEGMSDALKSLQAELEVAPAAVQRAANGLKGLMRQGSLSESEFIAATKLALRRSETKAAGVPGPPRPPSHAPPPPSGKSNVEMVAVVIPAGVAPGQMVEFTLADGRRQRMTVPQGSRPGQTIQIAVQKEDAGQKTKAEAGTREFEITVPPGCVAGQILAVECPGIPDAVDVEIPRGAVAEDRLVVRVVVDGEGNIEVITRARSAPPPPPPQKPKGKGLFKMALFGKKVTGKTASRLLKKAVGGAGVEAEQSKPTRWKNIFSKRIFFREGPLFNAKRIEDGTDTGRFLAVEAKNEFIVDLVKTKRENIAGEMVDVNFLKVDTPNGTGWVFDRHPHTAEVIVQKLE